MIIVVIIIIIIIIVIIIVITITIIKNRTYSSYTSVDYADVHDSREATPYTSATSWVTGKPIAAIFSMPSIGLFLTRCQI